MKPLWLTAPMSRRDFTQAVRAIAPDLPLVEYRPARRPSSEAGGR
jgi:hypothetical protein